MSLDGFSMHRLVAELNNALAGGRIDKITQPNRGTLQFFIRQPGETHILCVSIHPQNPVLYLLDEPLENPKEPPSFCMLLRKQLETGRVAELRQHGLDRVVRIDVDFLAAGGRIVTKSLFAELMGKYSNLILTEDGNIIDALRRIGATNSRVRLVLPGTPYELPPGGEKLNVLETSPAAFLDALRARPEARLVKALGDVCLGFGPVTAKEVAFSAGLPADMRVGDLDDADLSSLAAALGEVTAALSDASVPASLLRDGNRKLLAMAAFPLHYLPDAEAESFPSVSRMLLRAEALIGSYVPPDKERFQKLVRGELARSRTKLEKLEAEVREAENADECRVMADNLMTYQYRLQDHADAEVSLTDVYSPEGATLVIPLDRRLTVQQNIQAYYKKYAKRKRARRILKEQLDACAENIRYLASIETSLVSSSSLAELADIRAELIASGLLREKAKKKPDGKPSEPFRFRAEDGTEILVGKNNAQNDRLTFRTADRDDVWLHAKDIPGSHVILRTGGAPASESTLLLAAAFAARYSQAAGSSNVPVDYTLCRYVKKPSGAKPGFVIFTHQKTLYVTPDEIIPAERIETKPDEARN